MLRELFTEHPNSVEETYAEHMGMAFSFAGRMFRGAVACLIHGFLPFLFVKTGSATIDELHERMVVNRQQHAPGRSAAGPLQAPAVNTSAATGASTRRIACGGIKLSAIVALVIPRSRQPNGRGRTWKGSTS